MCFRYMKLSKECLVADTLSLLHLEFCTCYALVCTMAEAAPAPRHRLLLGRALSGIFAKLANCSVAGGARRAERETAPPRAVGGGEPVGGGTAAGACYGAEPHHSRGRTAEKGRQYSIVPTY